MASGVVFFPFFKSSSCSLEYGCLPAFLPSFFRSVYYWILESFSRGSLLLVVLNGSELVSSLTKATLCFFQIPWTSLDAALGYVYPAVLSVGCEKNTPQLTKVLPSKSTGVDSALSAGDALPPTKLPLLVGDGFILLSGQLFLANKEQLHRHCKVCSVDMALDSLNLMIDLRDGKRITPTEYAAWLFQTKPFWFWNRALGYDFWRETPRRQNDIWHFHGLLHPQSTAQTLRN